MRLSNSEYSDLIKKRSPASKLGADMLRAFLVGGLICALGEGVKSAWLSLGLEAEDAGTMTSVSLVFFGVFLTLLGVYDKIAKFAGAGTLVPITGFANSIAAPAIEFKTEGLVTGTAVKMFTISGPVIVYSTAAAVLYGVILCLLGAK